MSVTQVPISEEIKAIFFRTDKALEELARAQKDLVRTQTESEKRLNKKFEKLGDRLGELIEAMVEGGIIRLFQKQGYKFTCCSRHVTFRNEELHVAGEVDLFLENGEYALLVEVKTNLSVNDVKNHVRRLRKYRIYADARGDKRQFLAAAGGGVVRENVREFALKQGMYVIQQSGENVELIPPKGKAKVW
jgi:hypothetical protein